MPTPIEKSIQQSRRAKGMLVPLLEGLFRYPVEIEDDADVVFLAALIERRATPRKANVYSPSMLGSCVRQVYFSKTGQKKKIAVNKKLYGIFLDGTFRHFKWQFALWKLHREQVIELLGCEIYVKSKRGDYGGTLDALVRINDELYIVDFKGMNAHNFMDFLSHGVSDGYTLQIAGYGMLVSTSKEHTGSVENCLLVGENKNGPVDKGSPLGLHEELIKVSNYKGIVQDRLLTLRSYEARRVIPPPECNNVSSMQFQSCPFSWYCRGEVEIRERKAKRQEKAEKNKPQVRRSTRSKSKFRRR
jgi:hypothetical protein